MNDPRGLTDEEYRLFSERIGRSLADDPLAVPTREHREQVAELVRKLGEATHYHLLGIDPGSGAREVHEGYDRIARIVHPSHARRLELEGREGVLELLFERATLAYLTLSDTDRRKRYDRDVGPARWTALRPRGSRQDEARRALEQARALAAADEFHSAIELLRQSVVSHPTAEAYGLLGMLLAKNPQWLREATEALEKSQEMGLTDPEIPAALRELREAIKAQFDGGDATRVSPPIPFKPRRP